MKCITVNTKGEVSQIFDCNGATAEIRHLKTFVSDDEEILTRIQKRFKVVSSPVLTDDVITTIKSLRANNEFGKVRDMLEKYLNVKACCTSVMDDIINSL